MTKKDSSLLEIAGRTNGKLGSSGISTIEFNGVNYPLFQASGNSARFALPFAKEICTGPIIFDIGYGKEEWKFPGAIGIDKVNPDERLRDPMNLPDIYADSICSFHCLEHLPNYTEAITYWKTRLKKFGTLFLYLPHWKQEYWRSNNNTKHIHNLSPKTIRYILESTGWKNVFVTKWDLNYSFYAIAENS